MKKLILLILILLLLSQQACALEFTAPVVPDAGVDLMPPEQSTFTEDLWYIVKKAVGALSPDLKEAALVCLGIFAVVILLSVLQSFSSQAVKVSDLAGCVAIATMMLTSANALISLGSDTVVQLSEYGKLLLPVMTAALAAQGALTSSAAMYTGTALFNAILSALIAKLLIPMIYIFLALSIANCVLTEPVLKKLKGFIKWMASWCLKTVLYVFTGYISVTGVISGTADAAALKATKITISGMVPVVGGILADASEAVIVGAGVLKSGAGVYGLLAIISVAIGPFLKIGVQYLLLKLTAAIGAIFGSSKLSDLLSDFTFAMGFLLAMTGAVCLLLMISTVCMMKGAG